MDPSEGELEVPRRVAIAGTRAQRAPERVGGLAELTLRLLVILGVGGGVTLTVEREAEIVVRVRAQVVVAAGLGRAQERFARLVEAALFQERQAAIQLHARLLGELPGRAIVRGEGAFVVPFAHGPVSLLDVVVLREERIPGRSGRRQSEGETDAHDGEK